MRLPAHSRSSGAPRLALRGSPALLVLPLVAIAAGCAGPRDSVTVGSIPDDYRTRHPIVLSEKEETVDLPVGISDYRISRVHKVAVDGYLARYDRKVAPTISIMVPVNAANEAAAREVAREIAQHMYRKGVPDGRIVTVPYDAGAPDQAAPIRLSHQRMQAHVGRCGRWPDDLLNTVENKQYENFGCASQNNLAAHLANPADLLGPRAPTEIDAENRDRTIDDYRAKELDWDPEVGPNMNF